MMSRWPRRWRTRRRAGAQHRAGDHHALDRTGLAQGVHHLQRRGVRPLVILLDPQSFDEELGDNQRTHDTLVAAGMPVIAVRRGDPLVHVLEQGPQ